MRPDPGSWIVVAAIGIALGTSTPGYAQDPPSAPADHEKGVVAVAKFLGGAAVGLAAHESGHVLASALFGAHLGTRPVDFHGIPFFAIIHSPVSRRKEYVISSAGFWMQHATSEWLLTHNPRLATTGSRVAKGVVAFNVLASAAYSGAAFARTGPAERDTRSIASTLGISERWVGAMVLAPALIDAYRYFHPRATWARWASRGVKVGMVVLVVR